MVARQLCAMALERLPRDAAEILQRAAVWPDCVEDCSLLHVVGIAGSKKETRLLPPVSKKQQRLQNTAVSTALDAPYGVLEVCYVCFIEECEELSRVSCVHKHWLVWGLGNMCLF